MDPHHAAHRPDRAEWAHLLNVLDALKPGIVRDKPEEAS